MVLAMMHLTALASLTPLLLALWLKLALAALIVVSAFVLIRRHALIIEPSSIRELVLKEDGSVEGMRKDGSQFEAGVSARSTVLPRLIVMLLVFPGSRRIHPLVILPDSLPPEEGRILRAWLRWKLT